QKLDELSAAGGVQILMQGGHHPKLPFQWYIDLLQHIRKKYPHINIHGFSPPEFQHFAETFGMPLREVISQFKKAGLGSIPGGGGEILVDRVRQKISPLKINSDQWLQVMQVRSDLLQHIRKKYPHINIHGFSPPEFQHFAETFGMPLREVISQFKKAGLGSIPGGGGEILVDRVRQKISPLKINSDQWLQVMQV